MEAEEATATAEATEVEVCKEDDDNDNDDDDAKLTVERGARTLLVRDREVAVEGSEALFRPLIPPNKHDC